MSLQVPIAFIIFNRPEETARVFAEIARARPSRLIVVADGPRTDVPGEAERCARAREVIKAVDWECEVVTDFSDRNLGCRTRVSSGLDFVFDNAEEAIILEDDCLPHPSFFSFCEALLEKYRNDEAVMAISGDNFHGGRKYTPYSYFFSRFVHIWGWASWRRAWKHYDVGMQQWSELRNTQWLEDKLGNEKDANYWRTMFDKVWAGEIDTWDFQWLFSCWLYNGFAIVPEVNLVSNIGFGVNATHTEDVDHAISNVPLAAMQFPMSHPRAVMANRAADEFESQHVFRSRGASLYARSRGKLATITPSYIRGVLSRVGFVSRSKDAK